MAPPGRRSVKGKQKLVPAAAQPPRAAEFSSAFGIASSEAGVIILSFYSVSPDTDEASVNYRTILTPKQVVRLTKGLTDALKTMEKR